MKTILVDAYDCLVIPGQGVDKKMQSILDSYPNKKIVLTNADDEQIISLGLTNLPYQLFSLKHHPDKTNPEYFRIMLRHFDLSEHDVVYFEHTPEAVTSAREVGITVHYFDPKIRDLALLKNFLDKYT